MSASEKLRALTPKVQQVKAQIALWEALPQIVAVVEAASDPCLFDYDKVGDEKQYALRAALAALDEALS